MSSRRPASARRIVLLGLLALAALFGAGWAVMVPWIGRDLSAKVIVAVQDDGVRAATFHGQDGVLLCDAPLADPDGVLAQAEAVRGVHAVELDPSCGVAGLPPTTTTTTTTSAPPTTAAPTTTAAAPTTTAQPTTTTVLQPLLTATLRDGTLTLSGVVGSAAQRDQLVRVAGETVTPGNVVDGLTVDEALGLSDDVVNRFVLLMKAMPPSLVAGTAGTDGTAITADGTFASADLQQTFASVASAVGAAVTLTERPAATADDASAMEAELNALVGAQPILFEKGSTTISAESLGTLQRVAGIAERFGGVAIEVQGHTDSEGDAGRNLELSEARAAAVRDALIGLGVPAADVSAAGFGETELIVGEDGAENAEASRRVVFGVVTK